MEKEYERFFKLLYSLLGLVMSGARKIKWLNDQIQRVRDLPQPHKICRLSIDDYWKYVDSWDQLLPGHGERVMDLVGRFYGTPLEELTPKEPVANLIDRVRTAIFWDMPQYIETRDYHPTRKLTLDWNIERTPVKLLSTSLTEFMLRTHGIDFEGGIRLDLKLKSQPEVIQQAAKMKEIYEKIRQDLFIAKVPILKFEYQDLELFLTAAVWSGTSDCYFSTSYATLEGWGAFRQLLDLYLAGNFPCAHLGLNTVWVVAKT